ncbi:LysR family transcriptional regulator [Kaistia dalseonensis]|uniref:DNA-binding transcriptional LysR family regulator n=1 Tax=Kaistia dalseonensis TaxID=410840 RepID=A0ABU0H1U7_9HYPH|nr:LysR family transcriptional regulator [Kaistia dalseonensis]MCX5493717.1 LysR family transcriptional regulator [Kaistia dalseonensis]MDQ0436281.1 DNA-binding transcriptional LysR family regulator [Kaistia dalseonensis]
MSITFTHLKYFHAVARYGGFSSAAAKINISQPALTRHIQGLEDICGVALLTRGRQGVVLTPEGEALLAATDRLIDAFADVEDVAASFSRRTLRIRSVTTPKLGELMRRCKERIPSIDFDVTISTYDQVLAALRSRECDVGFLTMPGEDNEIDAVEVGRYPFFAYASLDHEFAMADRISVSALSGQKIIISPRSRRSRQVFDGYLQQFDVQPETIQEVSSVETIWHLAHENIGIGILPYNGQVHVDGLKRLAFAETLTIPLHFVSRKKGERSRLASLAFAIGADVLPQPEKAVF